MNHENYELENVSCYGCKSEKNSYFLTAEEDLTGKEGKFQYVQCDNCSLVYQNPRVSPESIKSFYDQEYIAHRKKKDWGILTPLYERAMNKHDREKEKIVKKYIRLSESSKVLDVGCAVGTFLLYLKDKYSCKISGVDFKDNLEFPRLDEIDLHNGFFYDQKGIADGTYDLITMWHFLEHCYDPKRSLEKAKLSLKDTGRLIIEVPRLDSLSFKIFRNKWPGVQAPQHTVLFDKQHFIKFIEDAGFEIEEHLPYGAFPAYFYFFAGSYFKLFGKGLNLDKAVKPYFLGQMLTLPFFLFHKSLNLSMQTIIAKKRL